MSKNTELARECGATYVYDDIKITPAHLDAFAERIRAAERMRCHELVADFPMRRELGGSPYWNDKCKSMAFAIMVRIKCPDFDKKLEKGRPQ